MTTLQDSLTVPQLSALREKAEQYRDNFGREGAFREACDPEIILALLDRLEALEKDRERLDFLVRHSLNVNYDRGDEDRWDGWYCTNEQLERVERGRVEYRSLRDAIDAARQAGPEEEV